MRALEPSKYSVRPEYKEDETMLKRLLVMSLLAALALSMTACGQQGAADEADPNNPAAGISPQRGMMELEGDRVNAVGLLQWVELEGGFWAVTEVPMPEDETSDIIAVIANGAEYQDELAALEGRDVVVSGTRFDGMSIRMAGPEIEMDSVAEVGQGPAE